MKKSYVLLDVGGTQVKGGISDEAGTISGELLCLPSHAKESKEAIFDNFVSLIQELMQKVPVSRIAGIGMAFPGPFDYEKGISLMKGLDKYDSIYGISIEKELKKRMMNIKDAAFVFLHDVEAFAIGESWFGKAKYDKRVLCLCIGTGAGTAFVENKKPLKEETAGVPANGWIYHFPYKDTIIDDYLSVRGLEKISREILGQEKTGKELYDLCMQQDDGALLVYQKFGNDIKECICPFLDQFQPDAIVMGGQISKSICWFGQTLKEECSKRKIKVCLESDTSVLAMQGLFIKIEQEG